MSYLLNIPKEKLAELKISAAKEGTTIRAIIEEQIDEYLLKHSKSNNPQTNIEMFDKESILAIPNLYREEKDWDKFYNLMERKEDYEELSTQLEMVLRKHNRKLKDFA